MKDTYSEQHKKELIDLSNIVKNLENQDDSIFKLGILGYDYRAIGFVEGYLTKEKDSEPISFKDKLPNELDHIILICLKSGDAESADFEKRKYNSNTFEYNYSNAEIASAGFSHWIPFPVKK